MEIDINSLEPLTLAGMSMEMTLMNFHPEKLFQKFMPLVPEIKNKLSSNIFDLHIWPSEIIDSGILPDIVFTKWAGVQINEETTLHPPLVKFELEGGLYASFEHKGLSQNIRNSMNYFFNEWLPSSPYKLDNRPHIYEMDERYKGPLNPESIETIRLPIKEK